MVEFFQEASNDIHDLLDCLADSKLRERGLARGRNGDEWERSIILQDFRREFILVAAKAVSSCMLGKVFIVQTMGRTEASSVPGPSTSVRGDTLPLGHTGWPMCLAGGSTRNRGF